MPVLHRGVNLLSAEFGAGGNQGTGSGGTFSNANPGTVDVDYRFPPAGDLSFLADRGINAVRVTPRWERLQPTPGGPLDLAELGRLQAFIDAAEAAGIAVFVTLFNYGAYWIDEGAGVGVRRAIGDASGVITQAHFVDVWERLVTALASRKATVAAWALMNEPIVDSAAAWETITAAVVSAIRAIDSTTPIAVPLHGFNCNLSAPGTGGAAATHPGGPWISGQGPIIWEAHNYPDDVNPDDTARTYADNLAHAQSQGWTAGVHGDALVEREVETIDALAAWAGGETVWIGEFGWFQDEPAPWNALAEQVYQRFDAHAMHVTAWMASSWIAPSDVEGSARMLHYAADEGVYAELTTATGGSAVIESHLAPPEANHMGTFETNLDATHGPGLHTEWSDRAGAALNMLLDVTPASVASGTFAPNVSAGLLVHAQASGSFTLAPPVNAPAGAVVPVVVENVGAATITVSWSAAMAPTGGNTLPAFELLPGASVVVSLFALNWAKAYVMAVETLEPGANPFVPVSFVDEWSVGHAVGVSSVALDRPALAAAGQLAIATIVGTQGNTKDQPVGFSPITEFATAWGTCYMWARVLTGDAGDEPTVGGGAIRSASMAVFNGVRGVTGVVVPTGSWVEHASATSFPPGSITTAVDGAMALAVMFGQFTDRLWAGPVNMAELVNCHANVKGHVISGEGMPTPGTFTPNPFTITSGSSSPAATGRLVLEPVPA